MMSYLNHFLEKLLMVLMTTIVVAVSWQVFSRFVLAAPSSVTEELARFLLIWIGVLGAAYAYRTKAHLGLDLVVSKMAAAPKRLTLIIIELTVILFSLSIMTYGGISLVSLTLELKQISPALGWQMGLVYSVIPLSGVLITLYALENLITIARQPLKNFEQQATNEGEL
ncbi:TRAP transporter small permease [Colwellia sp. MEBiC06753]